MMHNYPAFTGEFQSVLVGTYRVCSLFRIRKSNLTACPHTDFPNGNVKADVTNGMEDVSAAASAV